MALLNRSCGNLFLTKAISQPLPTIYMLMWSSGRGNVCSPMLYYFVESKIGPSESCDTSDSDHWEMDNQGWGSKNGYNTNMMECGEQTIYCAFERTSRMYVRHARVCITMLRENT